MRLGICAACAIIERMFMETQNLEVHIGISNSLSIITRIFEENHGSFRFITEDEAKYILIEYSYDNPFNGKKWEAPYKGQDIQFFDDCTYDDDEDEDCGNTYGYSPYEIAERAVEIYG